MDKCKDCYNMDCIFISETNGCDAVETCDDFKPMANGDRIRSMSDEEFSHFLFGIQCAPASRPKEWLDWLKQEAENG